MGKRSCFDDLLFTALPSEDVLKALKEIILFKKIDWNPSNVLIKTHEDHQLYYSSPYLYWL